MVGRMEAFSTDFARSLRPASLARCTGSSGGFASYRRDPLLGTYREGGAGEHVRAVECVRRPDPYHGCRTSDAACYNFLYEIEPSSASASLLPPVQWPIISSGRVATQRWRSSESADDGVFDCPVHRCDRLLVLVQHANAVSCSFSRAAGDTYWDAYLRPDTSAVAHTHGQLHDHPSPTEQRAVNGNSNDPRRWEGPDCWRAESA